jgi:pyruvate ferredoxin oxidoreductase alpha subunit
MQFYCWSNQEIIDSVICSFKIAEKLSIPCMVCFDGFFISHTNEPVNVPDQAEIDRFLPPRKAEYFLDIENPQTFSGGTLPNYFMEIRYKLHDAFEKAQAVIDDVYSEYNNLIGRSYNPIEPYYIEDAEKVLLTSGSAASTVFHTISKMRKSGQKVGMLRIRQLRPFPEKELLSFIKPRVMYGVLDRNLSPGTGGVFSQEIRSVLNRNGIDNRIYEFIAGLGGRDITSKNIEEIFEKFGNVKPDHINWIGLLK